MIRRFALRRKVSLCIAAVLMIAATGCGTVQHNLVLQNEYVPKEGSKIDVGIVSNETGATFDIPIETMMKEALVSALREEALCGAGESQNLVTNCHILDYRKGDAFKRWLMPGWGPTVLSIRCELLESSKVVGTIEARRSVDAGGGYTIGAWEQVFAHVASDVAEDMRDKFAARKEP